MVVQITKTALTMIKIIYQQFNSIKTTVFIKTKNVSDQVIPQILVKI
jgi:hypothetical protein